MKIILWGFTIYILILNVVTTYRLIKDEIYNTWQKVLQICIVWLLPFIGAISVSYFLNIFPVKADKWWQKHWLSSGLLSVFFHIRYDNPAPKGYPSDMNAYSDYTGGWYDNSCHGFSDGGCGGGGE